MVTGTERTPRNALKIGTTGEVDSKEGEARREGLNIVPPNYYEVKTPQVELNGAMGALIFQPPTQHPRTKLIFDVGIDYPFLD